MYEDRRVDIGAWLRQQGLERYESAFRENNIDSEILPRLTAEDLKDIGVTLVGDRRRLLEAAAALGKETAVSETASKPCNRPSVGSMNTMSSVQQRRRISTRRAESRSNHASP